MALRPEKLVAETKSRYRSETYGTLYEVIMNSGFLDYKISDEDVWDIVDWIDRGEAPVDDDAAWNIAYFISQHQDHFNQAYSGDGSTRIVREPHPELAFASAFQKYAHIPMAELVLMSRRQGAR